MHVKHYDFLLRLSIHRLSSEYLQDVSFLLFKSYLQTLFVVWLYRLSGREGLVAVTANIVKLFQKQGARTTTSGVVDKVERRDVQISVHEPLRDNYEIAIEPTQRW